MSTDDTAEQAVEMLQELGLREYEARCFVGLSRLSTGTAREISEVTEVPRTRVYEATRVLAAEGLVEVQHSSPQEYRAVNVEEAAAILRDQYDDRVDRLADALSQLEQVESDDDESVQEVWAMTGTEAIANRAQRLIDGADEEVVVVVGHTDVVTDELLDTLRSTARDVDLIVGTVSERLRDRIAAQLPDGSVFVSGLEFLHSEDVNDPTVGRLLMVDRSDILVSTVVSQTGEEHAVYGGGFGNGMVVVARRLMAQGRTGGLLDADD